MSRYDLVATKLPALKAVVGWDRPLRTFFAQVFQATEREPEEGEAVIWMGTAPGELPTPEAAIAIVAPYALVPAELAERLRADRADTLGFRDGPQQARARLAISRR